MERLKYYIANKLRTPLNRLMSYDELVQEVESRMYEGQIVVGKKLAAGATEINVGSFLISYVTQRVLADTRRVRRDFQNTKISLDFERDDSESGSMHETIVDTDATMPDERSLDRESAYRLKRILLRFKYKYPTYAPVMREVLRGRTPHEISVKLEMSLRNVHWQISEARYKLQELITWANS